MRWTVLLAAAIAFAASPAAVPAAERVLETRAVRVRVDSVASGLLHPWGLAFLPDGRMLVTEKSGRLRIVSAEGRLSPPLQGVPRVFAQGQGGLLDVALDPNFASNGLVYLSYAEAGQCGAGTAVARGRLGDSGLTDVQVIFRQQPKVDGSGHFGSRLVFGADGTLFVTTGDRFKFEPAQDLSGHLGKVIRINPDGSVPRDNPFAGREGARPEIWSYGHRNLQGAALNPVTGALWTNEHGPRGGDEINIPRAGRNYGWPRIGYGVHYDGQRIGVGTRAPGMEQPVHHWDPSIAPSGMAFYAGDLFPGWRGSVFVGALKAQALVRLSLDGDRVTGEERIPVRARIRDVRQGPDGALYLLTDESDGAILRLTPAGNARS